MLASIQIHLSTILTLILTVGGVHAFVNMIETSLSVSNKKKIAGLLTTTNIKTGTRQLLHSYLTLNNKIFGRRIVSIRSFTASLMLTCIWSVSIILIYAYNSPGLTEWLWNITTLSSLRRPAIAALVTVLLMDYASICLTRKIFRNAVAKGKKSFAPFILLDLTASILLYYTGITIFKLSYFQKAFLDPLTSIGIWITPADITTHLSVLKTFNLRDGTFNGDGTYTFKEPLSTEVIYAFPEGVFFFASLLTSIWLWLYILAYYLAFIAVRADIIKPKILNQFSVEDKPLTTATTLMALIILTGIFITKILALFL